jgi:hypothetical protein
MRSRAASPHPVLALSVALLPLMGAAVTGPASGAPPAAGVAARVLQLVDFQGDLIVTSPTAFLTAPTPLLRDRAFRSVVNVTGFAVSPQGEAFIVGTDEVDSWLGRVSFSTGIETTVGRISGIVVADIAFDGAGNLFGLTDDVYGASTHSLVRISRRKAFVQVVKVLDDHDGTCYPHFGAIAFNPADGSFYYSCLDPNGHLFVDRLAPGTYDQTTVLTSGAVGEAPTAMAFDRDTLWLATFDALYSADITNLAGDFSYAGSPFIATQISDWFTNITAILPSRLACVPGPTVACLFNRFKIEVAYDAGRGNGRGPASVVLDSRLSVGFTFLDPGSVELIVKIVDACSTTGKWQLSAGGLTDSGVSITVTDTASGAVRTYASARRQPFRTVIDNSAFSCP